MPGNGLGWLEPALDALRARHFRETPFRDRWSEREWLRAAAAALAERLGPALSEAVTNAGVELPREAWAALMGARCVNERCLDLQRQALDRLRPSFDERRIDPVILKGLALSRHYTVRDVREASDVDLLVPQAALSEAERVLRHAGFQRWAGGGRSEGEYALSFLGGSEGEEVSIDLHPSWQEVKLSQDGTEVVIDGQRAPIGRYQLGESAWGVLPAATELYLAAAHAILHNFRTLSIYLDVAVLLDTLDRSEVEQAARLARTTGRERHLKHVLAAAGDLFGVEVPSGQMSLPRKLGVPVSLRLGYAGDGFRVMPSSLIMELMLRRGLHRKLAFARWVLGHRGEDQAEPNRRTTPLRRVFRGLRWFGATVLRYRTIASEPLR